MRERAVSSSGLNAGEYELQAKIAAGGMGEIFVARKRGVRAFEKRVALKLLLPDLSSEGRFVQMFLEEARLAAQMNHPNIVQIFDFGQAGDRYYLAMALVEGVSLAKLLSACREKKRQLPLKVARLIASGLCEALEYVHQLTGERGQPLKLIHRDVNPANVMVSATGAVLLTDFGIARAEGAKTHTAPGQVIGKLAYMAPEQARAGEAIDQRADIFAAGVTLFETFTGVSPFRRDNDAQTLHAVLAETPADPRAFRPELSTQASAALLKALSKERTERFSAASELLAGVVDGPMSRSAELGALVKELCGSELNRFEAPETGHTGGVTHTRSLLHESPAVTVVGPGGGVAAPSRMVWRVAIAAVLLVGLGAALAFAVRPAATATGTNNPTPTALTPAPTPMPPIAAPTPAPVTPVVNATSTPDTQAEPAKSNATRKGNGSAKVGYLSADAEPWGTVFIGKTRLDDTPLSRYPLPAGTYFITVKNPQLGVATRKVVIRAGEVQTINVDLRR